MKPGANHEGYWHLANMAIQFETLADICDVMYPGVKFVASFDNSQNHRGKRLGALDITTMNKSFGGVQPPMDTSTIPMNMLQPFRNAGFHLEPGATQYMIFKENDIGPYYMSPAERLRRSMMCQQILGRQSGSTRKS